MASLSIARPGKVSERQYLGDLTTLFERHRRRSGLALTLDSFGSDLSANDALRSGLFTLCRAISHMGDSDLSPEELLGLVARSLTGSDGDQEISASMRDAFLSGYQEWRDRDLQRIVESSEEVWPPPAAAARKPPASEPAPDAFAQNELAAAAGAEFAEPMISSAGRRTVQEALSLVRRERAGNSERSDSQSPITGTHGEDLGNMTLGELKRVLEEIEGRVSRLGPHIQHLSSAAREPVRCDRDRSSPSLPESVIPFPSRRSPSADTEHVDPHGAGFDLESFARRRPIPAPNLRAEDLFLAQATETDERPRGIDALVAAAPAWANAIPTARSFSEDAFLARHAYLSPARRPGSEAPASINYAETPTLPIAPPVAALPANPLIVAPAVPPAPDAVTSAPAPPLIGLDVDDEPLLSPIERIQAFALSLSPRKVFLSLAGLTIFAGGLAGVIAYRTLHTGQVPQFKDLESTPHLGAPPSDSLTAEPGATMAAPLASAAAVPAKPTVASSAGAVEPKQVKPRPHTAVTNVAPAGVWPPLPEAASQTPDPQNATATGVAGPLYVPASTMIGYVLASPQPAYPVGTANGISGTVSVAVTISRTGTVTSDHAVSGPAELRAAAVAAVRGWRFRPFLVGGTPTEVTTTLEFYFKGD